MTDHHPRTSRPIRPAPTPRQQRELRRLAMERGVSFVPPRTRFEASRTIDQLKRRAPDLRSDRRREIRAVQDELACGSGDAARVRESETTGFGSTATWKGGES